MASRLYAWALWVIRRRGRVTAGWLLVLAVVGGLALSLSGRTNDEFTVPGVESQQAQDLLKEEFPQASGAVARVVFASPDDGGELTDPGYAKAVSAGLKKAAEISGVTAVTDPAQTHTVSASGTVAYADVTFDVPPSDLSEQARSEVRSAMDAAREAGLEVEFGGTAMAPRTEIGGIPEVIGVVIALIVLAVTLGSLIAAGLPLVTAVIGVGIGVLGVLFLTRFVDLSGTATVLAVMLGLAVGIDYALFIIARHREQLAEPGSDLDDSIARAVATAGSAVVFAGATVVIALAALAATGIPFLTAMGLAAAATVLLAVLIAVSLVPALLSFAGERLRPRRAARPERPAREAGAWGRRWGSAVAARPVVVLVTGIVALLALAVPALDMRLGLPSNAARPTDSTQHKSYDLLTEGFGPGFNAALAAVVDVRAVPDDRRQTTVTALRAKLAEDRGVAAVAQPVANARGTVYVIGVVPRTGPDDQATTDLVHRLRDDAPAVGKSGATLYLAGTTAAAIDVSGKLAGALPLFVAIIVVLAFILLTAAFRSLLIPLKAVLGFLLSVAAATGASVWVFQDGHLNGPLSVASAAPVTCFLPVLLIGVLFGLAMDYEVFLVSRMREHHEHTGEAKEAVVAGMARSGRVVCAAALIMTAVFAGFIFNDDPIIKSIGFSLAIGVAIDAFIVRMALVPAAMALLGRHAWKLPAWLDRLLPHIDIEGAGLPPRGATSADRTPEASAV
ncbi:MMPL family transporter [Streptomyces sp. DSM 41014]|uniref:MMPL family transporter n=1 Tax=Streptomyces hintoniae TaxID=3075521 RepID=A0ABU2UIT9_9ACTN|nr:MMPL family transporter [Streptomyces sp. DSM 41014]MDT0473181.1 MMPL family transporter [Streptomyces sp. DSM 41014]